LRRRWEDVEREDNDRGSLGRKVVGRGSEMELRREENSECVGSWSIVVVVVVVARWEVRGRYRGRRASSQSLKESIARTFA
jgi:hypothetical protein